MGSITSICSALVAILATLVGLMVLTEYPKQLGLYRFMAQQNIALTGLSPAFHYGIDWKYTWEEYYANCPTIRGQQALVTGANTGLGFAMAQELAKCGVNVILTCRSVSKCETAISKIQQDESINTDDVTLSMLIMDTSSMSSVQKAGKEMVERLNSSEKSLDMVFLNAGRGIMLNEKVDDVVGVPLSVDGIENIFATNVIGHHLLWKYIAPFVEKSPNHGRVVLTSSAASFDSFKDDVGYKVATSLEELHGPKADGQVYYGHSKLAQIVWAKKLTRDLPSDSSVFVNSAHPGAVDTEIWSKANFPSFMDGFLEFLQKDTMWSGRDGALTLLYLGVQLDQLQNKNVRGKFFHPQAQEVINVDALDEDRQDAFWKFCDELVSDYV